MSGDIWVAAWREREVLCVCVALTEFLMGWGVALGIALA